MKGYRPAVFLRFKFCSEKLPLWSKTSKGVLSHNVLYMYILSVLLSIFLGTEMKQHLCFAVMQLQFVWNYQDEVTWLQQDFFFHFQCRSWEKQITKSAEKVYACFVRIVYFALWQDSRLGYSFLILQQKSGYTLTLS